jgi:hypothetical protein
MTQHQIHPAMTIAKAHHYAIDAASLLESCLTRLRETIILDKHKRHASLVDMEAALVSTERLLLAYICQQIDLEREAASSVVHMEEEDSHHKVPPTLSECMEIFQSVLEAKKRKQQLRSRHAETRAASSRNNNGVNVSFGVDTKISSQQNGSGVVRPAFEQSRSPVDSLLFRLIVTLQLCVVRIDNARFVISGRRYRENETFIAEASRKQLLGVASKVCLLGLGSVCFLRFKQLNGKSQPIEERAILRLSGKIAIAIFTGKLIVREWGNLWMTTKIMKSTDDVKEWQQHGYLFRQRELDVALFRRQTQNRKD